MSEEMKQYEHLEIEIIELENEDVISCSGEGEPVVGPFVPANP